MEYQIGMPERQSNGVYLIGGVMWYSVWSFKKEHGIIPNNNDANLFDAISISKIFNDDHITVIPEIGEYRTVKGFREKDLKEFYKIQG
ncbi:TPA: hypothetical protein SIA28_000168 [Aeromonas salmonicida]|nr:hypothetical protein [Aeromonas salmonicida]HEH9420443.1 hypothetical protein [Aeromonas salmonicida]HEH9433692.1 hypothetical protein [Aeromonas salmonicida]